MLYRKKNPHGGAAYEAGVELDLSANTKLESVNCHTNNLGSLIDV